MSSYKDTFIKNVGRVNNLTLLYPIAKNTHKRPTIKETDILRAAVVFLHSAFEDYIRAAISEWLPKVGEKTSLCKISLLGQDWHTEKFTLSMLKEHETLSVSDLISRSVIEHMSKVSFNNVTDVITQLSTIHIKTNKLANKDSIEMMICRRHRIVHEMDKNLNNGRGQHHATSIKVDTVNVWVQNVVSWVEEIDRQISSPTFGHDS